MNLDEIKALSKKTWVPILRDNSTDVLFNVLKKFKPKSILEIGTCIGYSGILMLKTLKDAHLTSIEIDKTKAETARQNFLDEKVLDRAEIINDDAINVITKLSKSGKTFDFIFLDGPKGQYLKYLPILKGLLNSGGVLMADDIFFHGYVKGEDYPKHKHRTIIFRLREFIKNITSDSDFQTIILEIDDGISISVLKR